MTAHQVKGSSQTTFAKHSWHVSRVSIGFVVVAILWHVGE